MFGSYFMSPALAWRIIPLCLFFCPKQVRCDASETNRPSRKIRVAIDRQLFQGPCTTDEWSRNGLSLTALPVIPVLHIWLGARRDVIEEERCRIGYNGRAISSFVAQSPQVRWYTQREIFILRANQDEGPIRDGKNFLRKAHVKRLLSAAFRRWRSPLPLLVTCH